MGVAVGFISGEEKWLVASAETITLADLMECDN